MQIKDEIGELNPHEAKFDVRKMKIEEEDGVDPAFNALRVFPPKELSYPDIDLDGDAFYDKIGCPHLREKYKRIEMMDYHAIVSGRQLSSRQLSFKNDPNNKTTNRLTRFFNAKVDWRMCDICPEDLDEIICEYGEKHSKYPPSGEMVG